MTARIIRGNALALPLPDASVDLIVTSPPYFGLRSYTDAGEHYAGQIGSEATPAEFVAALLAATREMVRVLKPSGSIFVNLGDKYAGNNGGPSGSTYLEGTKFKAGSVRRTITGAPTKSLIGIPWRYALACIDQLGLILRAEIIWAKCLSGGTMVYARTKGRVQSIRLHDLCRHYQPEDVQLWTGEKWSQVRAWEPTPRGDDQLELELMSGERIGCTPEHYWPTNHGLLKAGKLQPGDILESTQLPDSDNYPGGLEDKMVGWFVGLYIAEGSRSEQTIQIAGHVKELDRFKRLSQLADAYDGTARVHATGGNTATINLTGAMLRAILDTYVGGRTAKDKFLKPKCWERSNVFLRALLDGYLSGDGHWREDAHRWILGFSDNDALASDLRTLGARLGLSVRLQRCTHTGFGKEWPGWRGSITQSVQRRQPDTTIRTIGRSRARQFWDIAIEDEPHLFALASGVLTHNSNGLPESVTDRVRRSHETWFHFTRSPRYFSAVDEIREPQEHGLDRVGTKNRQGDKWTDRQDGGDTRFRAAERTLHPLGKLPGSVWTIPTQPLTVPPGLGVDHFAAFPMEWPRRIIAGWSPSGICCVCGEGRRPEVTKELRTIHHQKRNRPVRSDLERYAEFYREGGFAGKDDSLVGATTATITGYACGCPDTTAPTRPSTVLDPFGGTGTTALVADVMGRTGISVDMSADYCRLAEWRVNDPGQRAAAAQVERPDPIPPDQLDLFAEATP